MGIRTYKATGLGLKCVERALRATIRADGFENLVTDRPILFVANHFTRFETLVVPYVLFRHMHKQVRTLADHSLFHGALGRYLHACAVMSTRDTNRNRTIVGELMTHRFDWVIYPEGGLNKSKKVMQGKGLRLELPHRQGPPHTGAAVLALQAEYSRRRYLDALSRGDEETMRSIGERFGIGAEDEVSRKGVVIVPVTITFSPLRGESRRLNRLVKLFGCTPSERIDEELQVEGSILSRHVDACVRFGSPIEAGDLLRGSTEIIRGIVGRVSRQRAESLFIRRKARRLTGRFMRAIYQNLEVNFDHLFCWSLRALSRRDEPIEVERLHRAIYLAATNLRDDPEVHLHPMLRADLTPLVSGAPCRMLERAVGLAEREGILRIEGGCYVIDREAVDRETPFHRMRVERMTAVIANELEPVRPAVRAVERALGLREDDAAHRISRRIIEHDVSDYEAARRSWLSDEEAGKANGHGTPFLLNGRRSNVGVVLVHGYLSCPEQMRPLAAQLHEAGFNVYAVRLDGHATAPQNLTTVRWEHWVESIVRGCAIMRHQSERVVVGGFSLGGLLSLEVAAMRSLEVAGVFSINAPMRLRDRRARLAPLAVELNAIRRALRLGNGHLVRRNDRSESPDINYDTDYLRGLAQLMEVARRCRRRLGDVRVPALVVQAEEDPVVSPRSGRIICERLGSERKELVEVPLDRHIIVRGQSERTVGERVVRFVERIATGTAPARVVAGEIDDPGSFADQ